MFSVQYNSEEHILPMSSLVEEHRLSIPFILIPLVEVDVIDRSDIIHDHILYPTPIELDAFSDIYESLLNTTRVIRIYKKYKHTSDITDLKKQTQTSITLLCRIEQLIIKQFEDFKPVTSHGRQLKVKAFNMYLDMVKLIDAFRLEHL